MKNTKKIDLPKNKILILLSIILVVFIGLLSACILIQSRYAEPTIADINPSAQTAQASKDTETEQKAEKKAKKSQTRILRSENGKMEITNPSSSAPAKQGAPAAVAQDSGSPSIDAVTAEVSGAAQKPVPLTSIPAPVAQGEQTQAFQEAESDGTQNLVSQDSASANLLDAESGNIVAKAQTDATPESTAKSGVTPAGVPSYQSAGTLIFVFDDAGHNMSQLQPFLELPFPVTIAVLPGLEYSSQAAQKARSCGKEVLLHQPMQAKNRSVNPGPGAIEPNMTPDEVYDLVRQNLAEVGPVSGINNHEGSLITENENLMGAVMDVCRAEQLYFLDSRTTSASVAKKIASQRGLPIWERSVFLDNTQNRKDIETAVRLGMEMASKNGSAIMIGHIWTGILPAVLVDLYPEMIMQGYTISTISKSRSHVTGN